MGAADWLNDVWRLYNSLIMLLLNSLLYFVKVDMSI